LLGDNSKTKTKIENRASRCVFSDIQSTQFLKVISVHVASFAVRRTQTLETPHFRQFSPDFVLLSRLSRKLDQSLEFFLLITNEQCLNIYNTRFWVSRCHRDDATAPQILELIKVRRFRAPGAETVARGGWKTGSPYARL
jgi:hypothetical protein